MISDPSSMEPKKAVDAIIKALTLQYEGLKSKVTTFYGFHIRFVHFMPYVFPFFVRSLFTVFISGILLDSV